jgi:hypothetical protein
VQRHRLLRHQILRHQILRRRLLGYRLPQHHQLPRHHQFPQRRSRAMCRQRFAQTRDPYRQRFALTRDPYRLRRHHPPTARVQLGWCQLTSAQRHRSAQRLPLRLAERRRWQAGLVD